MKSDNIKVTETEKKVNKYNTDFRCKVTHIEKQPIKQKQYENAR